MKSRKLCLIVLPLALTAGCINSHQPQAAYDRPVVVTPAPTSQSAVVRVYPDHPGRYESADTAVAETIRDTITRDPDLKLACQRVDIEVKNGRAILRGTVATERQRQEIRESLSNTSGIGRIEDHLNVELR
ncbi:MAG: hypothetical protein QOJ40_1058 [Verrucomicrobiota bacterium]